MLFVEFLLTIHGLMLCSVGYYVQAGASDLQRVQEHVQKLEIPHELDKLMNYLYQVRTKANVEGPNQYFYKNGRPYSSVYTYDSYQEKPDLKTEESTEIKTLHPTKTNEVNGQYYYENFKQPSFNNFWQRDENNNNLGHYWKRRPYIDMHNFQRMSPDTLNEVTAETKQESVPETSLGTSGTTKITPLNSRKSESSDGTEHNIMSDQTTEYPDVTTSANRHNNIEQEGEEHSLNHMEQNSENENNNKEGMDQEGLDLGANFISDNAKTIINVKATQNNQESGTHSTIIQKNNTNYSIIKNRLADNYNPSDTVDGIEGRPNWNNNTNGSVQKTTSVTIGPIKSHTLNTEWPAQLPQIMFSAIRTNAIKKSADPITFDKVIVNTASSFDNSYFTAPVNGIYMFSIDFQTQISEEVIDIKVIHDESVIMKRRLSPTVGCPEHALRLELPVQMNKGSKLSLELCGDADELEGMYHLFTGKLMSINQQ